VSVWYNKTWQHVHITPKHAQFHVKETYSLITKTKEAATKFKINKELKLLYKKKETLNEQLYRAYLEEATQW
jgi:hypothetical protein